MATGENGDWSRPTEWNDPDDLPRLPPRHPSRPHVAHARPFTLAPLTLEQLMRELESPPPKPAKKHKH